MSCLDETTLVLFLDRHLAAERITGVEHHIDGCTSCRRLLGELARGRTDPGLSIAPTQPAGRPAQPAGDRVDRYLLLRVLGAGAMGTVYAAYDPALDRKVAVKLLHAAATTEEGRVRLMREAQALARVSSPHVVAIHDVGIAGDQIYIAMELVPGGTVRTWLRERSRTWRDIALVFEAAGRGLAAAHARGLVHRDFKPDNVLLSEERVCVADFGLAAAMSEPGVIAGDEVPATEGVGSSAGRGPRATLAQGNPRGATDVSPLDHMLTRTGAVVGTPAYMAPEVLDGQPADARSDQFSFCVSLFEALYGERPFAGQNVDGLRTAIKAGAIRSPTRGPAALRALVVRGLAADPAARHPSIDELLARLAKLRTRVRRFGFAGAAAVLAATSATVAVGVTRADSDPCRGADVLPAPPYDPIGLRVVFATATPDGAMTAERVIARLDEWRHDVAAMRGRACRAAQIDHVETPELFDLRMECISHASDRVHAVTGELAHATPAMVDDAYAAIDRVADLRACRDASDLRMPRRPVDATGKTLEASLAQQLAQVEATLLAGHYADGGKTATAIAEQAAHAGLGDVEAHAWEVAGRANTLADQWVAADLTYRKAVAAAERSGSDRLRAGLYVELGLVDTRRDNYGDAGRWLDQATSLMERLQNHDLDAHIAWYRGTIAFQTNDTPGAIAALQRAIEIHAKQHPAEDHMLAQLWNALGAAQGGADGRRSMDKAVAIAERVLGPHHPGMVDVLTMRGGFEVYDGEPDAGIPLLRRAVAIAEDNVGRDHALLVSASQLLAIAYIEKLRFADARTLLDRVLPMYERAYGAHTDGMANLLAIRGETLAQTGHPDEAIADKLRALEIKRAVLPADSPEVAQLLEWLGRTQRAIKHHDEALHSYQDALAIRNRQAGSDASRSMAELGIGATLIDAGKPSEAIAHLEHAIALAAKPGEHDATVVAESHANLGRAYAALHQRGRAIALFEQAHAEYTPLAGAADIAADLAEVDRRLAEARRP